MDQRLKIMEHNSFIGLIPWPVAAATAVWFSMMAFKAGKSTVLWGIGGGLMGLVVTTIILGLGQATFIPFDTQQVAPFRMKVAASAMLVVACIGWLFTGGLHRHLLTFLKPQGAPPPPPAMPAKPPAASPKQ
jgi:hypothetical protein